MFNQLILDKLEEFYSSIESSDLVETNPAVGLPCVARSARDGRFYRAQISEMDDDSAHVVFVDCGNADWVPLIHLKRILPRFMTFPKLVRLFF